MERALQRTPEHRQEEDQQMDSPSKSMAAPSLQLEASPSAPIQKTEEDDPLKVDRGQITFDVEGTDVEGSRYFSRVIHYPGGNSGVTIGRGFDVGQRSKKANISYMESAGLTSSQVSLLAEASGLKGKAAGEWVKKNKDKVGTITHEQQKALFAIVYEAHKKDVVRISSKDDVVAKYGSTDFDKQHPAITDILVDLRYRGDYHSRSRVFIQKAAADNDLKKFAQLMSDSKWLTDFGVPKGRFAARKKFINDAAEGKESKLETPANEPASGGTDAPAKEETGSPIGAGVITASALNVRSGPGAGNPKAGKPLTKGAEIKIFEQKDGWARIAPGQWVSMKYVEMNKEAAKPKAKPKGEVTASALNVRSGPGGSNRKVGQPLKKGEKVEVLEEKNGWMKIGEGRWVYGKYIKMSGGGSETASQPEAGAETQTDTKPEAGEKEEGGKTDAPATEAKPEKAEDQGMVTASSLNVRKGPGGDNEKVGKPLKRGAKVTIYKEENGWYQIGEGMWVSAKFVRTGSLIPENAGGKPKWLQVAEGEIGVQEIVGAKHNDRVLEYHQTTGKFGTDEVPWCASFVNWVHKQSGISGTGSALAMSYNNWGKKVDKPAYGAVAVFSHGGGKGHVGFVVGKQGSNILVLGGNQSNSVKISSYSTSKIVAYAFPGDYEVPESAYSLLGMDDKLETEGYSQTR
jgi:uncharacterized protein (TIGR02594 family)